MRDWLPDEMARFRRIEQAFRDVCLGWGYEEVRTPTIEHLHLFTSAGTLSPQMLGRVYSFLDWDGWTGERVVLRPDSTIPVARLYAERETPGAVRKLFYVQNVLRFAQGDESREDWQCGVELIGDTQPMGDIELVLIAGEVLQRLGLNPSVKLSAPGILRAVLAAAGYSLPEKLALYDRILDGELSVLDEVAGRISGAGAPVRALLSMEGDGVAYLDNLLSALGPAVPGIERPIAEIRAVSETLAEVGLGHNIAPLLVRNFEYYTGPVFHFYIDGVKAGGGGRYDALLGLVGGADVPASGFALEMDVVGSAIGDSAAKGTAVLIRPEAGDRAAVAAAFSLAGELRSVGRPFRIAGAGEPAAGCEVVASAQGYTLRLNGSAPQHLSRAADVVSALSEAGL
jgi:histidyl-tRNA synthetase